MSVVLLVLSDELGMIQNFDAHRYCTPTQVRVWHG